MNFIYSGLLIGAGVVFYLDSDQASELSGATVLLLVPVLLSVPALLYLVIAAMLGLRRPRGRRLAALLVGIFACYLLIGLGRDRNIALVEDSQARGDELVGVIESYKREKGRYPEDWGDLGADGASLPAPALKGSRFLYRRDEKEGFYLSFPAGYLVFCQRTAKSAAWWCDD